MNKIPSEIVQIISRFLSMCDVNKLLIVNTIFKDISLEYDSCDMKTIIKNLELWRQKFPKAIGANIYKLTQNIELYDNSFFEKLKGIEVLDARSCDLLKYFSDVKILNTYGCFSIYGSGILKLKKLELLTLVECNSNFDYNCLEDYLPCLKTLNITFCNGCNCCEIYNKILCILLLNIFYVIIIFSVIFN